MPAITEEEYLEFLLAVAANTEPESVAALEAIVTAHRSGIDSDALADALRTLNAQAVATALGADALSADLAAAAHEIARRLVEIVGPAAAERMADVIGVEVDWETYAWRARQWVRNRGAALVTQVGDPTKAAIRAVIEDLFREPMPAQRAVPLLRDIVGMNRPQSRALENYWRRELGPALQAGEITEARANQLARLYRDRLIRHRAITISRTETMEAGNRAQRELWRAAEGNLYDKGEWVRESVGILYDGRICGYCYERHGWRAPINGPYQDGSDGPPWPHGGGVSAGCRCQERQVRPDDSQPTKPPFVEPEGGGTLRPMVEPRGG